MPEASQSPSWLVYERCVAAFTVEQQKDLEITVLPNVKLLGVLSGIERQIDVLIDSRWNDGINRRIIVDAKDRGRKVDVKDIESFEGMLRDCGASRGVIVCPNGYTPAAHRRAQESIVITILTIDELQEFDWVYEPCLGTCSIKTRQSRQRGMVLWAAYLGIPTQNVMHIFQTGKCDGCHEFHVWCWECGLKFAVPHNGLFRCSCPHDWICWPENDESEGSTAAVLMLKLDDEYGAIIDRQPLR